MLNQIQDGAKGVLFQRFMLSLTPYHQVYGPIMTPKFTFSTLGLLLFKSLYSLLVAVNSFSFSPLFHETL